MFLFNFYKSEFLRKAFVLIKAVNVNGEELCDNSVKIYPSRCIIDKLNKAQVKF